MAVTTGGVGNLVLGSAPSGFQAFAAGDDAKYFPYSIQDGTAWETGYGQWTNSGTTFARTVRFGSSTGLVLNVSTSAFLFVDMVSGIASYALIGAQGAQPGGRLTLESGVPVSTTDQTAKTTIYYTPYLSNVISLWDGVIWTPVEFSELSLALGTVTTDVGYDVFCYLSSGAATLEKLAWTSATARATAITLQDGRYCKSGDKTRLWIGSFYADSTTTTEDSLNNRLVYNAYNRIYRLGTGFHNPTAFAYSTNTWRVYNADTYSGTPAAFSNWFVGIAGEAADVAIYIRNDGGEGHHICCGREDVQGLIPNRKANATSNYSYQTVAETMAHRLGLNSYIAWQYGGGDANNWREMQITVGSFS